MQECGWNGNLGESIHNGISRWFLTTIGGKGLKYFPIEFAYCDDFQSRYEEDYEELEFDAYWRTDEMAESNIPVGAFFFNVPQCAIATVGKRLMELEKVMPGAGFVVWDVVERAIETTTGGGTICWIHSEICDSDNQYCDCKWPKTCVECEDRLTYDRFSSMVPESCISQRFEREILEKTLRLRIMDRQRQVIEDALALDALLRDTKTAEGRLNQVRAINAPSALPVLTQWKKGDYFDQIFDEYHDMMNQTGEGRDICWVRGWQHTLPSQNPGSIHGAARALKATVEILVRIDRILSKLDYVYQPRTPRDRTPQRVRVSA